MDLDQYPLVEMPDGSRHRIVPEAVLRALGASNETTNHFGKRIKALRATKGLSQGDLAQRSGLNQSKISRIESDHTEPESEVRDAVFKALGI